MTRKALFILGMHRSGTSAVAGTIVSRGAAGPKTPLPPTAENPKGYWEPRPLVHFHDRVLERAGLSWDSWDIEIDLHLRRTILDKERSELRSLVESEFAGANLFVLKDPRIALFLPIWQEEAPRIGITLCPVLVLRNPIEVALSLQKRDYLDIDTSALIWLRYNLLAERWTRDQKRYVFPFTSFLRNSEAVLTQLANSFGLIWPINSEQATQFVDPELRHHRDENFGKIKNATIRFLVKTAHQALESIAQGESIQAQNSLDAVSESLDRLLKFNPVLRPQRGVITQARKFNRVAGLRGYNLESPRIGSLFHNLVLPISGWAVPDEAGALDKLELWRDNVLVESTAVQNQRPDVATSMPTVPHAEQSGFKLKVRVTEATPSFNYTLHVRLPGHDKQSVVRTIAEVTGRFLHPCIKAGERTSLPSYSEQELNRILIAANTDTLPPRLIDQCLEMSGDLCESGHLIEAHHLLRIILNKHPYNRVALISLAAIYRRIGQPENATPILVSLVQKHPLSLSLKYEAAIDLHACERHSEVNDILGYSTDKNKENLWIRFLRLLSFR